EMYIAGSIFGLELLDKRDEALEDAFIIFYGFRHPNVLTEKGVHDFLLNVPPDIPGLVSAMTREDFFQMYYPQRQALLDSRKGV
ncbi:MAG: hypothetical protein ACREKL_03800, partial [Chthoniobacterales bacterium]